MLDSSAGAKRLADDSGWLQYHGMGRFPGQRQAISSALTCFSETWTSPDDSRWSALTKFRDDAVKLWSGLVGVPPAAVFLTENVTLAFHSFVEALPPRRLKGRTVLVAEDCFPSLHFLLSGLAPRMGFHLHTVRASSNQTFVADDDFLEAWDSEVALAVVNWVSSVSSKRCDLDRLVRRGRERDSLVAVDITQGVGIVPLNLSELDVDFAAGTTLKWLCGTPGAGFAYVAPRLIPELDPRAHGWFSQAEHGNWDLDRFSLAPDSRRFRTGTPSALPYVGSLPGLNWVREQSVEALLAHNRSLCRKLIAIADKHGLEHASPLDEEKRGGSIMIRLPDPGEAKQLAQRLVARGYVCDARGERLRWSPGAVTTIEAIEALDGVVGEALADLRVAAEVS